MRLSDPSVPEQKIEVKLFGSFSMEIEGVPLPKVSKSCQQLLAMLILAGESGLDRDQIAQNLWPDASAESARFYLRRTLTECRKALGPVRDRLQSAPPSQLKFDSDVQSDFETFNELGRSETLGDALRAIEISESEFLSRVRSNWAHLYRLKIKLKRQDLSISCAKKYRLTGDFARALAVLNRALAADPLDSEVLAFYWECLVELGKEQEFEQSYAQTLERYERSGLTFGTLLTETSKTLFRNLGSGVKGKFDPIKIANQGSALESSEPLVGRVVELNRLHALLRANRVVEVWGIPGIGKTRLLIAVAMSQRWPWLYAPLGGIDDAAIPEGRKSLLVLDEGSEPVPDLSHRIEQLLSAHPYLRILTASSWDRGSGAFKRFELGPLEHEDAVELLRSQCSDSKLNQALLSELADRLERHPLAVTVASAHVRLFGVDETLRELRDPRSGDALATELNQQLGERWMRQLCAPEREALLTLSEIPNVFPIELARHIVSEDAGSSSEASMVRLFERRVLLTESDGRIRLSELLRLCLRTRFSTCSRLNRVADYYLAAADSGSSLDTREVSIVETVIAGCAVGQPTAAIKILNWLGASLAEEGQFERLEQLTRPVVKRSEPSAEVLKAWMNLGLSYHRAHKMKEAARCYRCASDMALTLGFEYDRMRCLLDLGEVESNSGLLEVAEKHLLECADLARKLGHRSSEACALRTLGYVKRQAQEPELAIQYTTKALALHTLLGDVSGRVWCIGSLASCYFESREFEQARTRFLESLAIQREENNVLGVAWNLTYLAETCNFLGDLDRAFEYIHEALDLQNDLQYLSRRAWPLRILGENLILKGEFKAAEKAFCSSLDSVRDSGNRIGEALTLIRLAEVSIARGEHSTAAAYLDLAQEIGLEVESVQITNEVHRVYSGLTQSKL